MTIQGSYVGSLTEMGELIDLVQPHRPAAVPIGTRPLARSTRARRTEAGKVVGRVVLMPRHDRHGRLTTARDVGERSTSVICRVRLSISPQDAQERSSPWTPPDCARMQAPIKERYKTDPGAALITLKAKGSLDDQNIACKVETGRALAVAGLHPATGGSGLELCSATCCSRRWSPAPASRLKAVATALDIPLKSGTVSAEGDLDFRGTLGVAKEAPVGFAQIRLRFELDTDAPQEKLDQLLKLTERYCVVYQTIRSSPPVEIKVARK